MDVEFGIISRQKYDLLKIFSLSFHSSKSSLPPNLLHIIFFTNLHLLHKCPRNSIWLRDFMSCAVKISLNLVTENCSRMNIFWLLHKNTPFVSYKAEFSAISLFGSHFVLRPVSCYMTQDGVRYCTYLSQILQEKNHVIVTEMYDLSY